MSHVADIAPANPESTVWRATIVAPTQDTKLPSGGFFLFTSSCVTSQQHHAILEPVLAEGISAVEAPKSHGVVAHIRETRTHPIMQPPQRRFFERGLAGEWGVVWVSADQSRYS